MCRSCRRTSWACEQSAFYASQIAGVHVTLFLEIFLKNRNNFKKTPGGGRGEDRERLWSRGEKERI